MKHTKFTVASNELLKHLSMADGAISSKPIIPIIENFLFRVEKGLLHIASTDLDTYITTSLAVESDGDIVVAVPARVLTDTLKALPVQPITITVAADTHMVELITANGKYKIQGMDGREFPVPPDTSNNENIFSMPPAVMLKALNKTLFATSSDELRAALCGVLCEVSKDAITFVATDANRLVKYTRTDILPGFAGNFVLPKKALNMLKSMLPNDNEGELMLEVGKTNVVFSYGPIQLKCRLVEDKFPQYDAVIPTENPFSLTANRLDLMAAIKRASIYSNKTTHQIRLGLDSPETTVSAEDFDMANEATERLSCTYTGEAMEMGLNSKFVGELLAAIETEEILVELSTPSRAAILKPNADTEGETLLMLIMPMMLNKDV